MCKYLHYTLLWDVLLFTLITVINAQNLPETLASGTLYEYLVNELFNYGTPRGMQEDTVILDTDMSQNGSTQCQQDVNQMMLDLSQGQMYALNMLDASGKPPPGILQGNIRWIGRYDLCRDIKASLTQRDFNGRYCLTMSTAVNKSRTLLPEIGVCVPNSCSADVVNQLILSGVLGTDVLDIPKYNPNTICITDPEYSAGAIAALCICSILGLLIVGGTGISVFKYLRKTIFSTDEDDKDGILNQSATQSGDSNRTESENMKDTVKGLGVIENTLSCFCAITNGRKILAIQKSGPYSHLAALNGIRVLSMFWLILFHTHQFIPEFTDNPHEVTSVYQRFSGQVISNLTGTLAVDSFFVLSGMLVTYLTLNKLEKRAGQLNWAVFYFHRFWRLTPVYMIIIMLWATMRPYFTNGPLYWTMNIDYPIDNCRKYWWTNLLYINNLYPYYLHEGCMTWGWYLANDMQFYIISSLIIYFLYRYSKIGYAIIGALMTACFTSLVVVYMKYDLRKNPEQLDKLITLTYIRPWSRINSYLIGMIVGYVLYEMPRKRWKISKLGALLGWCCAIATGLGTVYGLYRTPQGHSQTKPEAVFYQTVFRTLWASAVGWVAFACAIGKGGPVNSILSWSAFAPLAKLTYCTYLLHPILLEVYYRSSVTPFHYTDYNMVYIFLGNLVLSFAAAYIMSVCAEAPFMALEKLILPTTGSSPPDKKQSSETSKLLQDSDHTLLRDLK